MPRGSSIHSTAHAGSEDTLAGAAVSVPEPQPAGGPQKCLTRRAPGADTAHGRAPKHASPCSGPGPSPRRGYGRGHHQGGDSP